MPTFRAEVQPDGSVVLPDELKSRLRIEPGSHVEFFLSYDGQVHFHAITETAWGWSKLFEKRTPPLSIREMDDAIVDGLTEDDERIRSEDPADTHGHAAE
ncbi:hypothetical protein GCM10008171_11680 [Methylopila jiangsuensis]|uniref:AbrB/MazE/SpoVT family DNA-binding domain-containing protein n=1 Tax=Methylopila jiangsuensis TaxID=586230 RepID=A0A9W6JH46_9HYPH|nr:hypothetical protein [Methylopila jiangsuensis]MDR6286154.1 bifunctional DNA-binding transcriptional regulator/antitoxin component of YhaV-PrlF toxin-antitoxin module [Methylopila jiangsuensis]GLK75914.1 hypothetical protein GCM10008171_11680 [Methylopila jiangsuensis]